MLPSIGQNWATLSEESVDLATLTEPVDVAERDRFLLLVGCVGFFARGASIFKICVCCVAGKKRMDRWT
jgi:hypothetical protein